MKSKYLIEIANQNEDDGDAENDAVSPKRLVVYAIAFSKEVQSWQTKAIVRKTISMNKYFSGLW